MAGTNTRNGGGRRLVLGFDAGCGTCSDLVRQIEERVGDRLEIRSLNDPIMEHWRGEAFGGAAPWAPTLVEVDGTVVRAWTGAKMSIKLAGVLGPISALRLAKTILAARSGSPAGSLSSIARDDPADHGINRGQFIRRLGSGALAASVAVTSIGGLSSAASAAGRTSTSSRPGDGFATVAERRQFNRAVEILAEHLRVRGNGTLHIDEGRFDVAIKMGQEEGVPRDLFRELASSVDIANEQILKGYLHGGSKLIAPGIQQVADPKAQSEDSSAVPDRTSARACRGKSGRSVHWWGIRMRLNSCQANTLIYYCTIEAGAATLCNKIWVIPCKIAAFVLLISCANLRRAADPGRGIVIDKSWSLRLPRVYSQ